MSRFCLLLLPVLLSACGQDRGESSTTVRQEDSSAASSDAAPPSHFYKRYSGTVAGRPVVVHLHRQAGKLFGACQFASTGPVVILRNGPDTVADDTFVLSELVPGVAQDGATWSLRIRGHSAGGTWHSPKGDSNAPLSLTEDYPPGSSPLEAHYLADSAALFPGKSASPRAVASCSYLLPVGQARGFVYEMLRKQLAPRSHESEDIVSAIRAEHARYFATYRKENADLFSNDGEAAIFALGYSNDEKVSVLYNDDYWLVTQLFSSSYTGGAHGNYGSSYFNIDLKEQRVWSAADMIADTTALRPMLADAAIAYFRLKPGEGMGDRLLVQDVPATSNVYLSAAGLSFVYNPYEIASYAAGQITLFLPYKKLMPYLTPAFKDRMQLQERSGVAMLSMQI